MQQYVDGHLCMIVLQWIQWVMVHVNINRLYTASADLVRNFL